MTPCKRCGKNKDLTIGIKTYKALICNDCISELISEKEIISIKHDGIITRVKKCQ